MADDLGNVSKSPIEHDPVDVKADVAHLSSVESLSALPPGTTDPVYELKARVLNNAVGLQFQLRSQL